MSFRKVLVLLAVCCAVMGKPTEVGSPDFDVGERPRQEIEHDSIRLETPDQRQEEQLLPSANFDGKPDRFVRKSSEMNPFNKGESIPVQPRTGPTEIKSGQRLEELSRILDEPWKHSKQQQAIPSSMERPGSMPRTKRSHRPRPYYNNYYGNPRYGPYNGPYGYDDYDYEFFDFEIYGYGY